MKKLLCCLLCLMMTAGPAAAWAENLLITEITAVDARLFELVGLDRAFGGAPCGGLTELINGMTRRLLIGDGEMYYEVTLEDTPVLTARAHREADGGWTAVSDLCPHYALTVTAETAQALADALSPERAAARRQDALRALGAQMDALLTELMNRKGEVETGEFRIGGQTFDYRVPILLTAEEWVSLLSQSLRAAAANEALPGLGDKEIRALEQGIAETFDGAEAELMLFGQTSLSGYASIPYALFTLTGDEQRVSLEIGREKENVVLHLETGDADYADDAQLRSAAQEGAKDALALDVYLVPGENALGIEIDVFSTVFWAAVCEINAQDPQEAFVNTRLYVGAGDAPVLRQDITLAAGDAQLPAWQAESRQSISLEALLAENAAWGGEKPLTEALAADAAEWGLPQAAQRAMLASPNAVEELMSLLAQPWEASDEAAGADPYADLDALLEEMMAELEEMEQQTAEETAQ